MLLHLGQLANIAIDPEEYDQYQYDIDQILGLVEHLQQVDTDKVSPHANPHLDNIGHQAIPRRPDVVTEEDNHEQLQQGAKIMDGVYVVPKVIE